MATTDAIKLVFYGALSMTECPEHPQPKYRECHHVGKNWVATHWGTGGFGREGLLVTRGRTGHRGSVTAWADKEFNYFIAELRARP